MCFYGQTKRLYMYTYQKLLNAVYDNLRNDYTIRIALENGGCELSHPVTDTSCASY